MSEQHTFTKYEIARIIGARALQISMDAPLLLKISKDDLETMRFDPLQIAEKELEEGVLPINIHRPVPRKGKDKIGTVKEDKVSDQELIEKAKETEKEIIEDAEALGFAQVDEVDTSEDSTDEK